MNDKWIAITGTSSGIGRASALRLARKGYSVLAGVRKQEDFDDLQAELQRSKDGKAEGRLLPLIVDVAKVDSVNAAVEAIKSHVGSAGLYSLINNAGIVVPGPVEFVSRADWQKQFDVNFFGPIQLSQGCLPLLRQAVQTYGRFVPRLLFVSSLGGRVAQPMAAPYTTSKFATSSLGDSLRLELYAQGIGVTVIEPGSIDTPIWGKGQTDTRKIFGPDHPARKLYNVGIEGLVDAAEKAKKLAISPDRAAKKLVSALERKSVPGRVLVGIDAKILARLRVMMPLKLFDWMLLKTYGLTGDK